MVFTITCEKDVTELRKLLPQEEIQTPEKFMEFADSVSKTILGISLLKKEGIIFAQTQRELFSILFHFVGNLHKGKVGGAGTTGRTLVGAKGIGKTHTAIAFVSLIESIRSDVYAIYTNALEFAELLKCETSLLGGVIDELNESRDLDCPSYSSKPGPKKPQSPVQMLCKALREKKKKLFLFVDEVDQIYRQDDVFYKDDVLRHLALIAESRDSEVAAVLCGSSAFLTELIKGKPTESMKSSFQLFKHGSINLNETKFLSKRVYSNLPVDLTTASAIALCHSVPVDIKRVRALAFATGANIRFVENFAQDDNGHSESLYGQDSIAYGLTYLSAFNELLVKSIYDALLILNQELFDELLKGNLVENIQNVDWEVRFNPLPWEKVSELYSNVLLKEKQLENVSINEVLFHLSDRSYVVLDGVSDGHPLNIYPTTLFRMISYWDKMKLEPTLLRKTSKALWEATVGQVKLVDAFDKTLSELCE